MGSAVHFLLVPDRAAARKVRRAVAENSPRLGVMVGTFLELLEFARTTYLLPESEIDFAEAVDHAAEKIDKAFWAKSLAVAQKETSAVLCRELERLLSGLGPDKVFPKADKSKLSDRAKNHLKDLSRLNEALKGVLPTDLALISELIAKDSAHATRCIAVLHVEGLPRLNPWQRALVHKLNADVASEEDSALATLLSKTLQSGPAAKARSTLHTIQADLYETAPKPVKRDNTVQWVGCRDYLEEVEVCAGMIQHGLREDSSLSTAQIGLLLPVDNDYARAVEAVFARAGLPHSGLVVDESLRDLGAELVRQYMLALRKPAPIMALAALVTNPLLPWSAEDGRVMADRIMEGKFTLRSHSGMGFAAQTLINAVNSGADKPSQLRKALELLGEQLPNTEALQEHVLRAQAHIEGLLGALQGAKEIPWADLLTRTQPSPHPHSREGELSREGIAVMSEGEEPWRALRALFVLGFQDGHYPVGAGSSPVFFEEDQQTLNESLGLELPTPSELQTRARERFKRQLCMADHRLTIFVPRRNGMGEAQTPSSSLVYMAQLIEGKPEAEELIWDLDSSEGRAKVHGLALAAEAQPTPPRALSLNDLNLKRNLLEASENGWPAAHQSPSSLDTLMVSPLAWVLSRYGLGPKTWAPQELDPALQGTLAHKVFERIFSDDKPLIARDKVESEVGKQLPNVIREQAPFLQAPEWRVERFNLAHQVSMAARRWQQLLATSKAKVVGVEIKLRGMLDDLPLKGSADSLLQLPGGKLFVVDFKKSSSGPRRKRMDKGYDSQANLYRIMLKTGGKKLQPNLQALLKSKPEIGIMYFLMNDQVALTDTDNWLGGGIEKLEEMGVDVADNAMASIHARLAAVKRGKITLNRESDAKEFDRNGVGTYALEGDPLVSLFTVPTGEEGP